MLTQTTIFDISKGRNNEISKEMNLKVDKVNQRQRVLNLIDGNRCTKEIAELLNVELHKMSGRISELKMLNMITANGVKEYKGSKYGIYKQANN